MTGTVLARFKVMRRDFTLDADLEIPARGITGVFGRSGAGKTTLLRCIAGLETPEVGKLVVDGDVWQNTETRTTRPVHEREIGYVFQEPRLFDHLNVAANLDYGWRRAGQRAEKLDRDEVIRLLGLGHLLHRRVEQLSGGEAQRVAIARALCTAPKLVLMDEPLSSLDEEHKEDILPFLERLHDQLRTPVVYVSHNIEEVSRLCDQLVVFDRGTVIANDKLQPVLTDMDVPILAGREAGSVLDAIVVSVDRSDELTTLRFSGGSLLVPGTEAELDTAVRVRVRASDVSLCKEQPEQTSILNVLPARIDSIEADGGATVLLRLALGSDRILARITRRSMRVLDLHEGDEVLAQIKSVTVRR